jgi:hypothetical protein
MGALEFEPAQKPTKNSFDIQISSLVETPFHFQKIHLSSIGY